MPVSTAFRRWGSWRRLSLPAQLAAALVPALVLVVTASVFLYQYLSEARSRSEAAARDTRVIARHEALLNAVLDAETGERGYLITGDPEFLAPYRDAADEFRAAYRKLQSDYQGVGAARARLERIRDAFTEWRAQVAEPLIAWRRALPVGIDLEADRVRGRMAAWVERLAAHSGAAGEGELAEIEAALAALGRRIEREALGERWSAAASRVAAYREAFAGSAPQQRADLVPGGRALVAALEELAVDTERAVHAIVERVRSATGKRLIDRIRSLNQGMIETQRASRDEAIAVAERTTRNAMWLGTIAPLLAFAVGLLALSAVAIDAATGIRRVVRAAEEVGAGHFGARVDLGREDEVGHLAATFNRMAAELESRRRRDELIERLRDLLMTSDTADEAYRVIERMGPHFFPGSRGCVYLIAESRNIATPRAAWPDTPAQMNLIGPSDCRALRSGRAHEAHIGNPEVFCPHIDDPAVVRSICVPLIAQDSVLGILSVTFGDGEGEGEPHEAGTGDPPISVDRSLVARVGEQLAVFLANLRLSEQLRDQSIRDPLTRLFNRRYLDETLERELARVLRGHTSLSVISLDIDHFKHFNDEYGHEAGDFVLAAVAGELQGCVRAADIVCRAGGEEFVMVLPDAAAAVAGQRAEEVRRAVETLEVEAGGRGLPGVTVSLGVATAPADADTAQTVLRRADEALYRAKRNGRNRVEMTGRGS